jgi:hypothetical protein
MKARSTVMLWGTLACLVWVSSCEPGDNNEGIPSFPERVLIGGTLPNQNQTDCRWLTELGLEPIPGGNCDEPPRIFDYIEGMGNQHVALVELALSPSAYGADADYMACSLGDIASFFSALVTTVHFEVLDDFGAPVPNLERFVFGGPCGEPAMPVCGLTLWSQAYVTPGDNLVFFASNCCLEKWKPGSFQPHQIYPVQDGYVYDWDGNPVPLSDVRTAIVTALAAPPGPGQPDYNLDCADFGGNATFTTYEGYEAFSNSSHN